MSDNVNVSRSSTEPEPHYITEPVPSPTLTLNNHPIIENLKSLSTGPAYSTGVLKSLHPQLIKCTSSESEEQLKDIHALLLKYRKESLLLSEIHMAASEYCANRNTYCTLIALTVSLLCSCTDPIIEGYFGCSVHKLFTTISFAFIGGLNVVFNFLAFQRREEKHKQTRDSYLQIVDMIEMALVITQEQNLNKVMSDVKQMRNAILKNSYSIPHCISGKYESILSPSLLKYELKVGKK